MGDCIMISISKTYITFMLLCISAQLFSSDSARPSQVTERTIEPTEFSYRVITTAAWLRQAMLNFENEYMKNVTDPNEAKEIFRMILEKHTITQPDGQTQLEISTAKNPMLQPIDPADMQALSNGSDNIAITAARLKDKYYLPPQPLIHEERLALQTIVPALTGERTIPELESKIRENFPNDLQQHESFALPVFKRTQS